MAGPSLWLPWQELLRRGLAGLISLRPTQPAWSCLGAEYPTSSLPVGEDCSLLSSTDLVDSKGTMSLAWVAHHELCDQTPDLHLPLSDWKTTQASAKVVDCIKVLGQLLPGSHREQDLC